jgi:hypothetical protein
LRQLLQRQFFQRKFTLAFQLAPKFFFTRQISVASWTKLFMNRPVLSEEQMNDVTWIGSRYFLDTPGFYDTYHSRAPHLSWPYDETRDAGLAWGAAVTFREDGCRVCKGHAPQNFSALRKFALALSRRDEIYPKRGFRSRRKTSERIPHYRASLLGIDQKGAMRLAWPRKQDA